MSKHFEILYTGIFQALKGDAAFLALVPVENIRKYFDPTKPIAGGICTYAFDSMRWDTKARRGEGQLHIMFEHPDDMQHCNDMACRFQELCDEDTLSGWGTDVHFFQETASLSNTLSPKLNKFYVTTAYRTVIVEGDVEKTLPP